MDATVNAHNNVKCGLEAEAELAGWTEAGVNDASEVERGNNKQVGSIYDSVL